MQAVEDTYDMPPIARKKKNTHTIKVEPGVTIQRVTGGYMRVYGKNAGGYATIDLEPGERLHEVPGGFVVQPIGAPSLNARGVANKIQRSLVWVHNLARRGPFDAYGGLQGYTMNAQGDDWIPKTSIGKNGSEVMFYPEDVNEWIEKYAPPREVEEDLERYKKLVVPAGLFKLFQHFGQPEQDKAGYVTRTRVMTEVKKLTKSLNPTELHKLGLDKPVSDRDYEFLIATAIQLGWGNNPKKVHNTSTYRRKPQITGALIS